MSGKNVVIVGGTAGLGVGLLKSCVALRAAKIWLVCRSRQRGDKIKADFAESATDISLVLANLQSMAEVAACAEAICAEGVAVDLIFLNAAIMPGSTAVMTCEGLEEGLAVNVCSQMLLSRLLVPALAPGARFIITGSDAGAAVKWAVDLGTVNGDAPMGTIGFMQYARTKCLSHIIAAALSDRMSSAGIDAHACVFHPGAVDSQMGDNLAPWLAAIVKPILRTFFRTPMTGATFGIHAATVANPRSEVNRKYFEHGNLGKPRDYTPKAIPGAGSSEVCDAAWNHVEGLIAKALGKETLPPLIKT